VITVNASSAVRQTAAPDRAKNAVPDAGPRAAGGSRDPVAIIGAGPGGLAAAMQLAASGLSVTVYEAQDRLGGRTRRITAGEFAFDCGPTFFMMPWVLEEIFAACGSSLAHHVELQRLDPMYRLMLGRRGEEPLTLDTTQDLAAMRERVGRIEPTDAAAFDRFIRDNRVKLERLTPVLRRPVRGWLDLMDRDALRAATALRPWRSVAGDLDRRFRNPFVRRALSFQTKYLGMSPYECPELFSILPFIEYEYGIWHPVGGCNALVDAMADCAGAMGVVIRTDSPVSAIDFDGRRARGVIVDGEFHAHRHVIINADATWALKHLIPAHLRGRESDERIDSKRYSCSTFMLYLGVRGEVDLPHHTIYTSAEYERNLEDIARLGRLSADPSIYCCNPSPRDPTLAPPGHSSIYLLVPVPNCKPGFSTVDWAREAPLLRERALDQVQHAMGAGDLRGRIVEERMVTPLDWRAERINHGATFNLSHSIGQMLHRRPQHRMPGVDGVWFVGGGTHPGSGLPVIFLSSTITTRLLCEQLGRTHPFDGSVKDPPRYPRPRESNLRQLPADPGTALAPVAGVETGRA